MVSKHVLIAFGLSIFFHLAYFSKLLVRAYKFCHTNTFDENDMLARPYIHLIVHTYLAIQGSWPVLLYKRQSQDSLHVIRIRSVIFTINSVLITWGSPFDNRPQLCLLQPFCKVHPIIFTSYLHKF